MVVCTCGRFFLKLASLKDASWMSESSLLLRVHGGTLDAPLAHFAAEEVESIECIGAASVKSQLFSLSSSRSSSAGRFFGSPVRGQVCSLLGHHAIEITLVNVFSGTPPLRVAVVDSHFAGALRPRHVPVDERGLVQHHDSTASDDSAHYHDL